MPEKRIFEDWMNHINPYPNSRGYRQEVAYHNFKYKDSYAVDMKIVCYGVDNKPSYEMDLIKSYPTLISSISMTWSSEEVARVAVTFAYDFFTYKNQRDGYPSSDKIEISTSSSRSSGPVFTTGGINPN